MLKIWIHSDTRLKLKQEVKYSKMKKKITRNIKIERGLFDNAFEN